MRNASALQLGLYALCLATAPLQAQIQPGQPNPQAESQPEIPATVEHLEAVVVNSLDGRPVARVLVTSPDRRMAVLTDSQGRFSFNLRRPVPSQGDASTFSSWPPGPASTLQNQTMPLQFMVRKPGYINGNVLLHVPAAKPDAPEPPLQLTIVPAATLTGHLDPDSGDPPEHVSVQLRRKQIQDGAAVWTPNGGASVDSRGQFRFANLEPGDYKLLAPAVAPRLRDHAPDSVTGFRPAFYSNADTLAAAQTIHLGAGDSAIANLAFRSATFYHVTIPVTGLPENAGFGVQLQPQIDGLYLSINQGIASGYLPSGAYDLQLTANLPGIAANTLPTQLSASVHLHIAGRAVQMEPIALHPGLELPIFVRRELTNPADTDQQYPSSLWVNLQPDDPSAYAPQMAPITPGKGDSGLKIENLTRGTFRVNVAPSFGYAAAVTSGATDLLREPLRVPAGSVPQPIEITLRDDFATLTIHVPAGDPAQPPQPPDSDASQVFLLVIPLDRLESQSFVVSWPATGQNQYTLPQQPPGRYLVLASHRQLAQNIEFRNEDVLRDLLSKGAVVTLSPSQKADVQVPFLPEDTN